MALAPDTATAVERRVDDAADSRFGGLPVRLPGSSWCVYDIPESWLPVLAWALSVELWDPEWSIGDRRAAIEGAVAQHREKGTPAGVKRALDRLGAIYDYDETGPFTCAITVHNLAALATAGLGNLRAQLARVKRASVVCTVSAPGSGVAADAEVAAGVGAVLVRPRALVVGVDLQFTAAGQAAVDVAANTVTFTRMAVGTGRAAVGADDSGRTTLRTELQRSLLGGVTPATSRVAARATFAGAPGSRVEKITEVGLIARIGAGAEFLAAYGAVLPGADAHAVVVPGVPTVLAAAVEVRAAQADVSVPVAAGIAATGAVTFAGLTDTPAALAAGAYYRANVDGSALVARTPAEVAQDLRAA